MAQHLADPIRLGVIVGVRGIKGEVRIKSFTDVPADIASYGTLYDRDGKRRFDLRITGQAKGVVLARIAGIEDRNTAEALRRTDLYVDRSQLPPPDEDEYYNSDLVGLNAETVSGQTLGKVRGVFDFGAGPVLEVEGNTMVPFTRDAVPEIDLDAGTVIIDPPEGFFENPDPEPQDDRKDDTT